MVKVLTITNLEMVIMQPESYEELNDKLLVAKQYIETIVDNIDIGVFTIGPKNYIKIINHRASQMLGLSQEDVCGLKVSEIIDKWEVIQRSIEKKAVYSQEETVIQGTKGAVHCVLSAYPIIESGQFKYDGIVCTITEIKNVRNLGSEAIGSRTIYTFDKIIGENKEFLKLIDYAKQISDSPSTVLITGESGTGKEMFAQSIHNESSRRDKPFIAINCGSLPKNLIESELFGYEEGAFTGAAKGGRAGKFELADGGTLFLDEIGEMPIEMQTNLLRVLENGKLFRIGSNIEIKVNVRIIAATNRDLKKDIVNRQFRKDLFYRLNVLPLKLLPLNQRRDDIPLLIDYFIKIKSSQLGKRPVTLSRELMDEMASRPWQGNVRELENNIERIINTQNSELWNDFKIMKSQENKNDSKIIITADKSLDAIEKNHIEKVIKKCDGNITTSAEILGIARNTLYRKIKKYDILI